LRLWAQLFGLMSFPQLRPAGPAVACPGLQGHGAETHEVCDSTHYDALPQFDGQPLLCIVATLKDANLGVCCFLTAAGDVPNQTSVWKHIERMDRCRGK
jgi:hypothetical protein